MLAKVVVSVVEVSTFQSYFFFFFTNVLEIFSGKKNLRLLMNLNLLGITSYNYLTLFGFQFYIPFPSLP